MSDWPASVNAAIIASLALITAFAVLSASVASPVGPVRAWARWTADDGAISLEHPAGWAVRDIGAGQPHILILRSEWVRIHVISAAELASVVSAYASLPDEASRYRALELVHQAAADAWGSWMGDEQLEEGSVGRTVIGGKRAVWTQFRYVGSGIEGGEPMTGYRATIIGESGGIIAGAIAPSRNWDEFKPIALRVLQSIRVHPAAQQ
ncbi:MAG TPA: hypothetical protein DEP45_01340 [Armatimonadetes bacterium]|nr:hypothetical protein [Armatimonadota bacterium]